MKESPAEIVIKFAGDSGDGIQLLGAQFTANTAIAGNDFATFPNYPAEIRAPKGTIHGVSGFQIQFGATTIHTPGDEVDVLVAMNAAGVKAALHQLKRGGILICDVAGFDKKNKRLAGYNEDVDFFDQDELKKFDVIKVDASNLTIEALKDVDVDAKTKARSKNMFVLGMILWMYSRSLQTVEDFLTKKFKHQTQLLAANIKSLEAGYYFGETSELAKYKTIVKSAELPKGLYRNIMGNQAVAYGLMTAASHIDKTLFYGSYPITPASDILHELVKYDTDEFPVTCFQAEDEIAAVSAAIGASFGGALAVTGTSGPGMALKSEAINLALMLEIPLVVVNVQRAGPSTGMPTKTEQSDLLFAMYGRNGESPLPIVAAYGPSDCFESVYWAAKIAVEFMTPVVFLSDGYIANGSEPWQIPNIDNLPSIQIPKGQVYEDGYQPYIRNENFAREWVLPGEKGKQHRIGGLEKEWNTGNVSYDPENHEKMVKTRAAKINQVASCYPSLKLDAGKGFGKALILGWGNTFGVIQSAAKELIESSIEVSHLHLKFIHPFHNDLENLLNKFEKIYVSEINNGQLIKLLQQSFPKYNFIAINKIQGIPFKKSDIVDYIRKDCIEGGGNE